MKLKNFFIDPSSAHVTHVVVLFSRLLYQLIQSKNVCVWGIFWLCKWGFFVIVNQVVEILTLMPAILPDGIGL